MIGRVLSPFTTSTASDHRGGRAESGAIASLVRMAATLCHATVAALSLLGDGTPGVVEAIR